MYNKDNSQLSLYHIYVVTTTDNLSKILARNYSTQYIFTSKLLNDIIKNNINLSYEVVTLSYKKCPIIFIDILGTKENSDFETQFKIQTMFHNALEKERGMDANHNYTVYKRFITTFSDCAYIVYDYKDEIDAHRKDDDRLFLIALYNTEKLIVEFLKEGFLCRGACTFGEVYYDEKENMLFGPAVNEVYILEQKKAIYPRIIINPNIAEHFTKRNAEIYGSSKVNGNIIKLDKDGISFLHVLNTYDIGINLYEYESLSKKLNALSMSTISKCKTNIQNSNDETYTKSQQKIIEKHEWMLDYLKSIKTSFFKYGDLFN